MHLNLIEDKIAFKFLEDINNGSFSQTTSAGIIVQEKNENQLKKARWGVVIKCAPSVTEVEEGDTILIEPLGWTNSMEFNEIEEDEFWITTEDKIMAVSVDSP